MFAGGEVVARRDAADALREALNGRTLYQWAAEQSPIEKFVGRATAYGVTLGTRRIVVRHARRGGLFAPLLQDRYFGRPRFLREIEMSRLLANAGITTPAVVAGVMYPVGLGHRADVATERIDGRDLAEIFFGPNPPAGKERAEILGSVGRLVRRLHDAGLIHPDLQLRNILITSDPTALPPYRPTAVLLDVDTCRPFAPADESTRRWNLARFARSWEKFNRLRGPLLTDQDRAAFAAAYRTP